MGGYYPVYNSCDCSAGLITNNVVQCRACGLTLCDPSGNSGCVKIMEEAVQRRILNQARVPSSQLTSVKGALYIGNEYIKENSSLPPYQNLSDRTQASHQNARYVDRRRTSHKPGQMGPAGDKAYGVDVKHGSYARYLGKLKAQSLSIVTIEEPPKYGNKTRNLTLMNTSNIRNNCKCK